MNDDQKAKLGRVLGYICIATGALNLTLVAIRVTRGHMELEFAVLGSGITALMLGIIMLARAKRTPASKG